MYTLKVKKEKLVEERTIKIVIDGVERGRTSRGEEEIIGKQGDDKLVIKALFLKTNKLECPKSNGVYNLTWKQNYIPIVIFVAIIFMLFMPLANDGYETSERLVVLVGGGVLVKLLWNDLLILGRKIKIEKEEL